MNVSWSKFEKNKHLKDIQKLEGSLARYLKFACVSKETR